MKGAHFPSIVIQSTSYLGKAPLGCFNTTRNFVKSFMFDITFKNVSKTSQNLSQTVLQHTGGMKGENCPQVGWIYRMACFSICTTTVQDLWGHNDSHQVEIISTDMTTRKCN